MSAPSVSVLMPAYNRAHCIGEAIESVLGQTHSDLELIVVDDGSTDNTADVVQRFSDPRISLIRQQNKGISGALNTAFRAARGRYIARLDSDDLWLPDILSEEVAVLEADPAVGLVYCRAKAIDDDGRPLAALVGAPPKFPGQPFRSLLYGDHIPSITAVVRRDCFERAGLWDESLYANEDWEMWLRLALVCRFHFISKVMAYRRFHTGRTTSGSMDRFTRVTLDRIRVLDKVYAGPSRPPEARSMKAMAYRNVYLDVALKWLGRRQWRQALRYFGKALVVAPNPLTTIPRIVYLILFHSYLGQQAWATNLVHALADWRRRYG